MNKRLAGVLAFAVVVSAVASFLIYRLVSARLSATPQQASIRLLVAANNLQIGALVRDADISEADWFGKAPPQAIMVREDIVGRGVMANILQGEAFQESRLAPKGAGGGMAATIPVGMRAVAVRVNEVVGVAGFVTPGMRVDILILGTPPNAPPALGTLTKTLLQNIEVLSAGQQIQKDGEGKPVTVPVINLLVTPEQAEILSLASNDARIQLILRNPTDTKETKTPGTAMARLFTGQTGTLFPDGKGVGGPRRAAAPRPVSPSYPRATDTKTIPPPPIIVEIIHGTQKAEVKFQQKAQQKPQDKAEGK
jgi:pilus assembly protein CpaB